MKTLTAEQKQCPQGRVTGASKTSPQMEHLNDASSLLKPGAEVEKSVGSGTSEERKFIYCFSRSSVCNRETLVPLLHNLLALFI